MEDFESKEAAGGRREFIIFGIIIVIVAAGLYFWLHNLQQMMAGTILLSAVFGTLLFWKFRVAIVFIGFILLLLTRTLNLPTAIDFMSVDVILFLVGMMVIVGILRRSGFLRWLLAQGLKLSRFNPRLLITIILFLSSLMAAMVDEVTSILFMTALVLDFCDYFKVHPVKYVIATVLATNVGSSWTVLGNPIGILIALKSGLTFEDFLKTAFPIGFVVLAVLIVILLFWLRKDLNELKKNLNAATMEEKQSFLDDLSEIKNRRLFTGSAIIFFGVVILLALHYRLELALNLEHNTLLVGTSIFGAGVVMLWQRGMARELVARDVDWWTLLFFLFLFALAGAPEYVGLVDVIAEDLSGLTAAGGAAILVVLILWSSGIVSGALDNVVVVAILSPIVAALTPDVGSSVLWWALLFGGCYGGNLTMVGSTANIVALGVMEDRKGYHMTFGQWIKVGIFASFIPMAVATLALLGIF